MNRHLISGEATVVEALEALNRLSGETMTLFVTDGEGRLLGSLTDGDVRRALLAGHALSDAVAAICHRDCLRLSGETADAAVMTEARRRGIRLLPMVKNGLVVALVDLRLQRGLVPADAVLMAGGRGERLRPLTEQTPKPLLPVAGRPIIDHNIDLLRSYGIRNIWVAVNYLKEQIISHLPDCRFIEEPSRLGTIGALSLFEPGSPHVVVMNADLLTDVNLEAMYLRHIDTEAWLTVAAVPYTVSVPFAIMEHQGDRVTALSEKPTFNYCANAGIYILRREAIELIPKGVPMDATDLIDLLLKQDHRVSLFQLEGRWLDIGSPDDYRRALGE